MKKLFSFGKNEKKNAANTMHRAVKGKLPEVRKPEDLQKALKKGAELFSRDFSRTMELLANE